MTNQDLQESKSIDQKIDYFKILRIFLSRWYWIAACVVIAIAIAYGYLWYKSPVYSTSGSLKFDEKNTEFTGLVGGVLNNGRLSKIASESYVIQSREVLLNSISRLNYKISYFLAGRVRTTDIYPNTPFPIEILEQDSLGFYGGMLFIKKLNNKEFELSRGSTGKPEKHEFGTTVKVPGIKFIVKPNATPSNIRYAFKFNTKESFLGRAAGITIREASKNSNIMYLGLSDQNPEFAIDLLNAIMHEYVAYDVKEKGTSATQTIEFIEGQLKYLYNQVQESGGALESYKKTKGLVNLGVNTSMIVNRLTSQQLQRNALNVEEVSINQLEEQIRNNRDQVSLNFSLEGTVGGLLSSLIGQLNTLIIERDKKLIEFNQKSSAVQLIERQISDTKLGIISNIRLLKERNKKTRRYVEEQIAAAERELSGIPSAERDFARLQSDFDINQKVFTYLSEKRLEAQISRAAVVPSAVIVEAPAGSRLVSPLPAAVYTNAVLLGVAIGLGLILLIRFLNSAIHDKETVESLTKTPIIGVIRKFPGYIDIDNTQALSLQKPKSVFAESVRSVRTNLSFLAGEKASKIICVTSEVAGEGKSFVSTNIASTLALIDKRVVLLGADLRRSKLHKTFHTDNTKGLSSYLSHQSEVSDIIHKTSLEYLDFIPSGPVPPNPSELLHSTQLVKLLDYLKQTYDYILIDTAPVGLVSDSIPLIRQSDINLFVIRSGASKKSSATVPDRLSREYSLSNVVIVLNAFEADSLYGSYLTTDYSAGYGQQYYYSDYSNYDSKYSSGYYLEDAKPKWWKFWK